MIVLRAQWRVQDHHSEDHDISTVTTTTIVKNVLLRNSSLNLHIPVQIILCNCVVHSTKYQLQIIVGYCLGQQAQD